MKKYLFIIDTVKHGGAENILLRFSNYLQQKGIEYKIFVLFGRESSNIIPGEFNTNADNFFLKFIQQQILKQRCKKLKRQYRPDVVFSFLERSNIIALDTKMKNEKTIISVHNNLEEQYKKFGIIKQALIKYIIRKKYNKKASKIIAVSQSIKEILITRFGVMEEKIIVINNSVDRKKIQKMSEAEIDIKKKQDSVWLISIGRVEYQKAQWKLIKAIYYLKQYKNITNIELILLGDGKYLTELKTLAKNLDIEDKISFIGFVKNPFPYLKIADLLVLPSIYEGFPITVSEAAVLGVEFIGSQKAIPKEIFQSILDWEKRTYLNINTIPDFTNKIFEDDVALAELIIRRLNKSKNMKKATSAWEIENTENKNFDRYIVL